MPTRIFYVIRNRQTRKLYKNLPYHQRYGRELWTDIITDVRPYRTKGAAKQSLRYQCTIRENHRYRFDQALFDTKFEIIPVEITYTLLEGQNGDQESNKENDSQDQEN